MTPDTPPPIQPPESLDPPPDPQLEALRTALRAATRRHRAPSLPASLSEARERDTWTALAYAIERARLAVERGTAPDPEEAALFTESLLHLIRAALRPERGDPSFQAMALRHREPRVREYASLSAHAEQDRRRVMSLVKAMAHPAKMERRAPGPLREGLVELRLAMERMAWHELDGLAERARRLAQAAAESSAPSAPPAPDAELGHTLGPRGAGGEVDTEAALRASLATLRDEPALTRLVRLDALATDERVIRYQALIRRQGPASGSLDAIEHGAQAQRRGEAVEALAAHALEGLARHLDAAAPGPAPSPRFRVATSLRVPGSLVGSAVGAKVEWDVALLRQAHDGWDLCLLIEAKASAEAAATDLPKLLRGLRLLRAADPTTSHAFRTRQGELRLSGASLAALDTQARDLGGQVLYCCDGDQDQDPRLLGAASRMQLLCAAASLEVAARLERGEAVEACALAPVWQQLLAAPPFVGVLNQYPTLQRVREVMLHPADLASAVDALP